MLFFGQLSGNPRQIHLGLQAFEPGDVKTSGGFAACFHITLNAAFESSRFLGVTKRQAGPFRAGAPEKPPPAAARQMVVLLGANMLKGPAVPNQARRLCCRAGGSLGS